jgi:hypothetical protein
VRNSNYGSGSVITGRISFVPYKNKQFFSCLIYVLILARSPTLSYTQRLENRIVELEATLTTSGRAVTDPPINNAPDDQTSTEEINARAGPSRAVEDLRVEEDGRLSFHGSTSLFQLPASVRAHVVEQAQADQEMAAKKESLVNSAWRERAFEKLADTPVGQAPLHLCAFSS